MLLIRWRGFSFFFPPPGLYQPDVLNVWLAAGSRPHSLTRDWLPALHGGVSCVVSQPLMAGQSVHPTLGVQFTATGMATFDRNGKDSGFIAIWFVVGSIAMACEVHWCSDGLGITARPHTALGRRATRLSTLGMCVDRWCGGAVFRARRYLMKLMTVPWNFGLGSDLRQSVHFQWLVGVQDRTGSQSFTHVSSSVSWDAGASGKTGSL